MQAAIPLMRAQGGGSIVNVSSGTTQRVFPGLAPYSSTKHALNNLSLVARAELAPEHIVVSVVYPFITDTGFAANAVRDGSPRPPAPAGMQGDTAEYTAGLILDAVRSGDAEVFASRVQAMPRG